MKKTLLLLAAATCVQSALSQVAQTDWNLVDPERDDREVPLHGLVPAESPAPTRRLCLPMGS